MRKIIDHLCRWNQWRKGNRNSILHKILVLFYPKISPTYYHVWTKKEGRLFYEGFMEGLNSVKEDKE